MAPKEKNMECVKVVVRCRPMSRKEVEDERQQAVFMDRKNAVAVLKKPGGGAKDAKDFTYDAVYDHESTQQGIYEDVACGIVDSVMEGFNGTIFAYGQTGAGKSHTMAGPEGATGDDRGLMPRAFAHVFGDIQAADQGVTQFLVRASYLEIYNEEIRDLLSNDAKAKCELKENPQSGVYVKDLNAFVVKSVAEIEQVLATGLRNRSTGATLMNAESSRSHSIFAITVEAADIGADDGHIRVGKLNMVDLAGSERQSKTGATGDRLKEATKINLSLSALGNVISSLVDGVSSHIPYRDSKLTRLLQDSLGGNTKTMMVANCGPADYNYEETLSTLRYAYRAKSIKNKPRINEDPKDAMIREFQDEIKRLREQLMQQSQAVSAAVAGGTAGADGSVVVEKEVIKQVVKQINTADLGSLEQNLKQQQEAAKASLEAERKQVEEQRDMAESEKIQVLTELQQKEEAVQRAQKDQEQMLQKMRFMGDKMLQGSAVIEKALLQEKELRKAKQEEIDRQAAEARAREAAQAELEAKEMLQRQYASQEETAAKLSKKLEMLWNKYQKARQEIEDVASEFQKEKAEMMHAVRQLYKELEHKNLILENFVPHDEQNKLMSNCIWDEEGEGWIVRKPEAGAGQQAVKAQMRASIRRPPSAFGCPRPLSDYARAFIKVSDPNPRFRHDNILATDLELPDRVTLDYDERSPTTDPKDFESVTAGGGDDESGMDSDRPANGGGGDVTMQAFPRARGLVDR